MCSRTYVLQELLLPTIVLRGEDRSMIHCPLLCVAIDRVLDHGENLSCSIGFSRTTCKHVITYSMRTYD